MPELPEVETIVRGLRAELTGAVIAGVDIPWPSSVRGVDGGEPAGAELLRLAVGARIQAVRRRAKLALLELAPAGIDGGESAVLAVHLKMTGRLVVRPADTADPYLRVRFRLAEGDAGAVSKGAGGARELAFSDVRRFGYVLPLPPGGLEAWDFHAALGPEPLETTPEALADHLAGRAARGKGPRFKGPRIKALLLDQTAVAGIGNIYADESLHQAGIRPDRPAGTLSHARMVRLCAALQDVLARAIAENGSSIRDYRDAGGNAGAFQNSFRVYGRGGEACLACGHPLQVIKVAGRTSTFCPHCQR